MFCPNCGNQIANGDLKCSRCGEMVGSMVSKNLGSSFKGFLILLISFFTMPLKTLKITLYQLRELGAKGSLDIQETEIPHLTWLKVASHFITSSVVILIVIGGIISGIMSLEKLRYSITEAIVGFIFYPIMGVVIAILVDWLVMISLELIMLSVSITNDVKKIANK